MKKFLSLSTIGFLLLLAGCFQIKQVFTLNPDGSGKVQIEATFISMNLSESKIDEAQARNAISEIIEKSEGIEAWSDLTFSVLEDGMISMQATAYFPDINKVKIHNLSTPEEMEYKDHVLSFFLSTEQSGANKMELTNEQIKTRAQQQKKNFEKEGKMLDAFFETMKSEKIFILPGKGEVVAGKVDLTDEGYPKINFIGKDFLAEFKALAQEDKFWEEQVKVKAGMQERVDDSFQQRMTARILGDKIAPSIRISDTTPLFDYQKEVSEAKANFDGMLSELGIDPIIYEKTEVTWSKNDRLHASAGSESGVMTVSTTKGENLLEYIGKNDGESRWKKEMDMTTYGYTYLLTEEKGKVIASDKSGTLYAYDASNGAFLWTIENDPQSFDRPAYAMDGNTLFFGKAGKTLKAINLTSGAILWSKEGQGPSKNPTIEGNKMYFESREGFDSYLTALVKTNGSELWKKKLSNTSVAILTGEYSYSQMEYPSEKMEKKKKGGKSVTYTVPMVVAATRDSVIAYQAKDGKKVWGIKAGDGNLNWNRVYAFDDVVMVEDGGSLTTYALQDGSVRWTFKDPNEIKQASFNLYYKVLADGNTLYFISDSGFLYALDSKKGTMTWERKITERGFSSTPYLAKGNLFIGTSENYIFQVDLSSTYAKAKYKGNTVLTQGGNTLIVSDPFSGITAYKMN